MVYLLSSVLTFLRSTSHEFLEENNFERLIESTSSLELSLIIRLSYLAISFS